ncbi:hypothetical protein MCETHM1_03730 [Flavobacteriaceae bacterium]
MTIPEIKNQFEIEQEKERILVKEAEASVLLTLYMGLFLGLIPVIGFPITIPEMGIKILFIGLILGIAAFISSFFTGTLFGMPKRSNIKERDYSLNNSLVEISDWLTKIIVGLGLVNLKEIPDFLISLGEYVRISSKYDGQLVDIYSIGIVIYFGFLGLYIGYNYMRLVLSNKYKNATDNLLEKKLEMVKNEVLEAKNENELKGIEIIKMQSVIQDNVQLTKTLIKKVNEPILAETEIQSIIEDIIGFNKSTKVKEDIKQIVDKMFSEAKLKLKKGLISNNNDPQKGQWKSSPISNERQLKAMVNEEAKGLFKIILQIVSTNPKNNPLKNDDIILFALHNTFGDPPFRVAKVINETAELVFYAYGSFTVGAFVDYKETELELDLAELPNVSTYFKTH